MNRLITFCICTLGLAASLNAATLFLPNPANSEVVAGWIPTNAEIVGGQLEFDGPWLSSWPAGVVFPATFNNGSADWSLTTNFIGSNATGANAVYTFLRTNTVFDIHTANYAGDAFDKVIFQLTINSDNDRDLQLNPTLSIGSTIYTASQATFTDDRSFGGNFSDPTNRYYGHFGGLALVTYEWDLASLGYSGSSTDLGISWNLPQQHTSLYDVQVSVGAVPEPTTFGLAISALAGWLILRRRFANRKVECS